MAQYTQEDVDKIRDKMRKDYGYDSMSDEKKKQFDEKFDAEIENYRKQGIVEPKKNDNADNNSDDEASNDKGRERERTPGVRKDDEKTKATESNESREEALKKKEYERMDQQIGENQARLEADRKRRNDEPDKKEKDFFDGR